MLIPYLRTDGNCCLTNLVKWCSSCSYAKSPEHFRSMAAACVAEWRRRLYDPPSTDDPHYITFAPFDPVIHESARKTMMESGATVAVNSREGGGRGEVAVGEGGDGSDESGGGESNRGKSSDKVCFEENMLATCATC